MLTRPSTVTPECLQGALLGGLRTNSSESAQTQGPQCQVVELEGEIVTHECLLNRLSSSHAVVRTEDGTEGRVPSHAELLSDSCTLSETQSNPVATHLVFVPACLTYVATDWLHQASRRQGADGAHAGRQVYVMPGEAIVRAGDMARELAFLAKVGLG